MSRGFSRIQNRQRASYRRQVEKIGQALEDGMEKAAAVQLEALLADVKQLCRDVVTWNRTHPDDQHTIDDDEKTLERALASRGLSLETIQREALA